MTYEERIERLAARMGKSTEKASEFAEREISTAVRVALSGQQSAFDLLPDELRSEARLRWRRQLEAGEGNPEVRSFTHTGAPLR